MITKFLEAICGVRGTEALKPLQKSDFASWIPARAALTWVGATVEHGPTVPGTSIPMVLAKTDYGWTGAVGNYGFTDASAAHVVAAITVHLNHMPGRPDLKASDLSRLGRTIDALVKAEKTKGAGGGEEAGTGLHAAAIPPTDAIPPTKVAPPMPGPKKAKTKLPKIPKVPATLTPTPAKTNPATTTTVMKLSEAEAMVRCEVCGCRQFSGADFTGCQCFKPMAKSVKTTRIPGGLKIELSGWEPDAIITLRESMRSK